MLLDPYSADPDPTQNVAGILNFYIDDPLGTRRHRSPRDRGPHQARFWLGGVGGQVFVRGVVVMTDYAGNTAETCHSLPFGNGASGSRINLRRSHYRRVAFSSRKCHLSPPSKWRVNSGTAQDCAATPAEHLFTQHERDAETGNDYFGARYYASSMGRFLTPDWSAKAEPVPYSKLDDPQTLNLYAYVGNNPFIRLDADGHQTGSGGSTAIDNAEANAEAAKRNQQEGDPSSQAPERPKLGQPGGRQLDPNSAECKDLAKKIDNIATDIIKRHNEILTNPQNLELTAPPGSPLKASVSGHQELMKDRIDDLGAAE
ncbi:MAG: RHS repeat-associated core domain-containing protein [Acidobacteriota bacterium]